MHSDSTECLRLKCFLFEVMVQVGCWIVGGLLNDAGDLELDREHTKNNIYLLSLSP